MNAPVEKTGFLVQIVTSGRIVLVTMGICCILYTLIILTIGQALTSNTANGSLIYNDQGKIAGSVFLAQGFSRPDYFWPRPSAVDYNAAAAGGSNLSPTNQQLRSRAKIIMTNLETTAGNPVPADLVTASGSGLDPDITLSAAKYQAARVAAARGLSITAVMELLEKYAYRPGSLFTPELLVNVVLINTALDKMGKMK
jgi:potassium-transporting ATPase KdpC subunit